MSSLLHLAPGRVAPGQGITVLHFAGQTEDRDSIPYGHSDLACFEVAMTAPIGPTMTA